jgi:hypothetical protein
VTRPARSIVACWLTAIAGCGAPAPAPSLAPQATPAATSTAPPRVPLASPSPSTPLAPVVGPDAEPLQPAFDRIPLPPDAPPIVAVDGRGARDVWMLGQRGAAVTLLHWDGAHVTSHDGPRCPEAPSFDGLVLAPDAVIALGHYSAELYEHRLEATARSPGAPVARPRKAKKRTEGWSCAPDRPEGQISRMGQGLLRLLPYRELAVDGRLLPMPSLGGAGASVEAWGRSPEDLWLYLPGTPHVFHGNGLGWEARPPGVEAVRSLRVDETGAPWLVGGDQRGVTGHSVLSWDAATRAWTQLPTPRGLQAARIRVTSRRAVWVLGAQHVHRWDGRAFQRADLPLPGFAAAWAAPDGALWLVGVDRASSGGVAFRAAAGTP